ncbi:MAG: aldo/keto reductase [Oscillospiraceae bacterium]|jgi:aryl-alcohol dehydrogenase-like predicted oxidoreductase|nr:aldo/keto reductase [Oscillospiraceae bacterium]
METMRLGKTNLLVTRTAFGALPVQRRNMVDAVAILRRAYDGGIRFFDTARAYSDSEEKLGRAFDSGMRKNIVIATKTGAQNAAAFWDHLHTSLKLLGTEWVDIYQFHNPAFVPVPGGEDGLYEAALQAKRQGKIHHISITNHRLGVARQAVESDLYDTLQFPFSLLSGEPELALLDLCRAHDVGFIAMKALSGGLITDATATFAFIRQYDNVVPIWGIQHMRELEEFLALAENPPAMDEAMRAAISADRAALAGDFCRGCGYCLPCPAGIEIFTAARIYFLATRAPYQQFITPDFQKQMAKVDQCVRCGACKTRCPYGLDTPELLQRQYALYKDFVAQHTGEAV